MKSGSCSATTVGGSAVLPFVISTERSVVERSALSAVLPWAGEVKAMKNRSCSATTIGGSAASPLSSQPERSGVERSAVSAVLPWAGEVKAMKSGSCSATTVAGSAALPFVISTGAQRSGEICGVSGPSLGRRSQGDEAVPVQQRLLLAAPPSPLSSRPERSVVERSAVSAVLPWAGEVKAMKRALFSNYCCWKHRPPLISTGAQRSGDICGVSCPSLDRRSQGDETGPVQQLVLLEAPPSPLSSRPEESWAVGQPKAMKRALFSNYCGWKRRPPLCHLDRRSHGPSSHPRR